MNSTLDSAYHILAIDDSPHTLALIEATLGRRGYRVHSERHSLNAFDRVLSLHPDLILLDIAMPYLDGYAVCRQLKADPRTASIPVIFLSAFHESESKVQAFDAGGADYVTKPFHIAELIARAETHITLYRQQRALEASRRLVENVTAALPDMIFIYDLPSDTEIYLNHSWHTMLGYPKDSPFVADCQTLEACLLHPDDVHVLRDCRERAKRAADGEVIAAEFRLRAADGSYRHFFQRARVFQRAADGSVEQIISIGQDVTERKAAERQALELEIERERIRMMRELIRDVSHDFRTPLSVISTSAYLLQHAEDPGKRAHYHSMIGAQVNHLVAVLERMLTVARLDSGEAFTMEIMQPHWLLQQAAAHFDRLARGKLITLNKVWDETLPTVCADARQLRVALVNLIENALEHTPQGGSIMLQGYMEDSTIILAVHDTGYGIDDDDLPRIFDSFYRGDAARSVRTGGVGLGLSIVKRIVERHNGRIEVETRKNQGSVFRIRLPIVSRYSGEQIAPHLPH